MSNALYDDLTEEQKAILKREMEFRIEQQQTREKLQAQQQQAQEKLQVRLPAICIATGLSIALLFTLMTLMMVSRHVPPVRYGFNRDENPWVMLLGVVPGLLLTLFGIGLWMKRLYKDSNDKNLKEKNSKNKRG